MPILIFIFLSAIPAFCQPQSVFFVANEGQWDAPFHFKLEAAGTTYYVTESGLTIDIRQYDRSAAQLCASGLPPHLVGGLRGEEAPPELVRGHVFKMNFVRSGFPPALAGGQGGVDLVGEDKLPSYSNYFLGRDSCKWRSKVGHYQRVIARNVWPGIDVEFVADAQGIKTNYHVQPFADPAQIVIEYEGRDAPLPVDGAGNLVLKTSLEIEKTSEESISNENSVRAVVKIGSRSLCEDTECGAKSSSTTLLEKPG